MNKQASLAAMALLVAACATSSEGNDDLFDDGGATVPAGGDIGSGATGGSVPPGGDPGNPGTGGSSGGNTTSAGSTTGTTTGATTTTGGGTTTGGTTGSTTGTTTGGSTTTGSTTGGTTTGSTTGGTTTGGTTTPPVVKTGVAKGIGIKEIAIFQAVKISLVQNGNAVGTRNAPIVPGRAGLLRIYPQRGSDFATGKSVVAEVILTVNGVARPALTATLAPKADGADADLATTFNVDLPGDALAPSTTIAVALRPAIEADGVDPSANPSATYPTSGAASLGVNAASARMKIVVVPVRYNADGSGRVPDTSAAQVERYQRAAYEVYPAATVDVTVGAPFDWSQAITGTSGDSFSAVLEALTRQRQKDVTAGKISSDVYYYGAFNPAASFSTYCRSSCIVGLSGVAQSGTDKVTRASVGVGYQGQELTLVHEVGHALGRSHAPCGGVSGANPKYPYAGGGIGVWGYSLVTKKLVSPTTAKDFMGYCSPNWVSDFNFSALFTRISYVTANGLVAPVPATQVYRFLHVDGHGGSRWGETIVPDEAPVSSPTALTFVDGAGNDVGTITAAFIPYSDLDGGYYLVPEPPAGVSTVRLAGGATVVPLPSR